MAFVDGAISMMQTGLDFVEEESPFKLAADAASLGGTALDMAVNGPSWSGAADMAAAEPTSAWQPHSAPEMLALCLQSPPMAEAVRRKSPTFAGEAPGTWSSQ